MTKPSNESLIDLAELARDAAPGPWEVREQPQSFGVRSKTPRLWTVARVEHHVNHGKDRTGRATAKFIAAANPATILSLVDEILRLREYIEENSAIDRTYKDERNLILLGVIMAAYNEMGGYQKGMFQKYNGALAAAIVVADKMQKDESPDAIRIV